MYKFFIFLMLLTSSFTTSAAVTLTGEIAELWANASNLTNGAYIATGELYTTHCQPNNQVRYLVIDYSQPGMKEAYAMALAAFMSGKKVTLSGSSECHGQHEKLTYIGMKK